MHRFAALVLALVTTACVPELAPLDDDTGAGLGQDGDKEPANGNGNGNGNGGDDTAPEDTCFYADELGNEIEDAPYLGMIDTPGTICGELDSVANDANGYAGDMDFVAFQVEWDATYQLSLSWEAAGADYDLYVFEVTDQKYVTISDDYVEGTEHESVVLELDAGDTYVVGVAGWEGATGSWTVTVE